MIVLILGLLIFLGAHSTRIFADDWRTAQIARHGEKRWKGLYSLVSAVGLVLIVWGYGLARAQPVFLWFPPVWTRHLAALLLVPAFILIAAAYVPGNRIRPTLGHPMILGVKLWAFAHLISNGTLADLLLFGSFLVWAVLGFRAARRRDAIAGPVRPPGTPMGDLAAIVAGVVAWGVFAVWLHGPLIGVRPFG